MEEKEDFVFNPELHLEQSELSDLASVFSHPGFKVLIKVQRTCVDFFIRQWLNSDIANDQEILALHRQAKTAAQLSTLFLDTMKNAIYDYTHSQPSDEPIDGAPGLDFGEISIEEEGIL